MFKIKLTFCSGSTIELFRVDCSNGQSAPLTCVRGKTAGAYRGAGTFHWSSAVRATACVFLKAKISDEATRLEPMLSGGARTLAASLDYALSKQPAWILDMFGVSSNGKTQARRLFHVTNSHRKRGGPVSISLNSYVCPRDCIEIVLDGKSIDAPEVLRAMIEGIEAYDALIGAAMCDEEGPSSEGGPGASLANWHQRHELKAA